MESPPNQLVSTASKAKYSLGIGLTMQRNLEVSKKKCFGKKGPRTYYLKEDALKLIQANQVGIQSVSRRELIKNFQNCQEVIKSIPGKSGFKSGVPGKRGFYLDVADINIEFEKLDTPLALVSDEEYISEAVFLSTYHVNADDIKTYLQNYKVMGKLITPTGNITGKLTNYFRKTEVDLLFEKKVKTNRHNQ